jgi:hypothetical protein
MIFREDPRSADASQDAELPSVRLTSPDAHVRMLRRLQAVVLKHPIATKAAFAALAAEGLAYAKTPEGAWWAERLANSDLLHRARLMLDLPGFALLGGETDNALPSGYLDTIFMLASAPKPDEMLEPLFDWSSDRDD